MASSYAGISSAASLAAPSSLVRRHNVLRKTPISAVAKDLRFNKDGTAINKLQIGANKPKGTNAVVESKYGSLRTVTLAKEEESRGKKSEEMRARSGGRRLSSPRAGRELAVSMIYASCLQGSSDPLTLFDKRINSPDPTADEAYLGRMVGQYDETGVGGPPLEVETEEEEAELERRDRDESGVEAAVLGGPPRAVYARHTLERTRALLYAVTRQWDRNVTHINALVPPPWNHDAAGRILELSILHLAMSEIVVLRTRHQIVINEAVDLAKRFCDGAAPRTINGCLRSFVTLHQQQQQQRQQQQQNKSAT